MLGSVLCLPLVSFVIAWPLIAWLVRFGHAAGHLDSAGSAGHFKPTVRSVPNIGGIGIFAGIWLPALLGVAAVHIDGGAWLTQRVPALSEHLPGIRERLPMLLLLLGALAVLHILGLIDDRRPLGPVFKLAIQIAVAALVVIDPFSAEADSRLLTLLDATPGLERLAPWPSLVVTVIWLVVVTNAINMMDNMDGLAGGVSCIAAALFLVTALVHGQWFVAALLALTVGATLAFLCFNFPPARIFMGDGGSLVLGFLLGFLTIRTTYIDDDAGGGWYEVFMPVIVLAVPFYDLVTVVTIRLSQGRNPLVGDQQHFSHRLVQRGLSGRQMLAIVYGATLATGLSGIYLGQLREDWAAALVGVQTLAILGVMAVYEWSVHGGARRAAKTPDRSATATSADGASEGGQ